VTALDLAEQVEPGADELWMGDHHVELPTMPSDPLLPLLRSTSPDRRIPTPQAFLLQEGLEPGLDVPLAGHLDVDPGLDALCLLTLANLDKRPLLRVDD